MATGRTSTVTERAPVTMSSSTLATAVRQVRTMVVRMPLPRPLPVGNRIITHRDYAVLQIDTNDGITGKAYCLSRGAPMSEIVHSLLTPHIDAQDTDDVESIWMSMLRGSATVGRVGLVRKAIGLVDIALWDIAAQRAGRPLWQLLGNDDRPRRTMLVAAYTSPDRTARQTADELLAAATAGWRLMKTTRSADRRLMRNLFELLGDELPSDAKLVVDANFAWQTPDEALADIEAWSPPPLAWLEDPVLPEQVAACARIRSESGQRVGVGDEVTDPTLFDRLIDARAIDVLRLDVVAIGGITPARGIQRQARESGLDVSCHVYPEIAVHLGADIETFARGIGGNPYDPLPAIVDGGPDFGVGTATPPPAPGLGFDLCPELDSSAVVISRDGGA